MWIVGIDPGQKGGVALLNPETREVEVYDMPLLPELCDILSSKEIAMVFIEKQQAFPKQGIASTAKLMKHYGELLGVLTALKLPFEEVPPKRWQEAIHGAKHKKKPRKEKKKASILKARQMFPGAEIGRKDGRAEALLLAEWGRRLLYSEKFPKRRFIRSNLESTTTDASNNLLFDCRGK